VRYDSRRIIVRFKPKTLRDAINAVFARANVQLERNLTKVGLYAVRAPDGKRDQALASLRREKSVGLVEREVLLDGLDTTPNDPAWPDQWGLRTAGFPKAWDVTRGSKDVVVAVLDTGVDKNHPELKGGLVPGRDIVNNDSDPADDNGHGTAVAGIVAARGNNGIGLAGACWACLVMPVKVLGKDGTGTTADVAAGLIWAADHGAKVINLSLGSPGTTAALSEAVDYAERKDVVVVAAAGNSSASTPFYPAADGSVIGVAASNESDQLYSWSNRGAWVQVTAPGCNDAPWPGGGYVSFCGTSSAAPLVAGIAALVRSAKPTATAIETAQAVNKTVDAVPAEVRNGRVNAGFAVSGQRASDAGKAQSVYAIFRGRLGRRYRSRAINRVVGAGQIVAVLKFSGARKLSLLLLRRDQAPVRVSGKSPLTLRQQVASGPVTFLLKGAGAKASYQLAISYAVP
jgi:subtilisin family serine protease